MKKIYAAICTVVTMIVLASGTFAQTTTRSLTWNLTGAQNWPTVGAGNTWDNRNNWVITGAGTVPATNVTNGDKLIIPNTAGVIINITADLPISFNNFVIEVQGAGLLNLQSGVDLTLTGPATAFSLSAATASSGLTLQKAAGSNNTTLIINSITKAINTANNSALLLTSTTSSRALSTSAQAAAATGYGGFLLGALPVVLNNFSAGLITGQKVGISWTTQQEVNTDRFDLQKSTDGINWTTFATVKASGNSSSPLTYSGVDIAPAKGANYYRIASVDLDGTTAFTSIRNVRLNAAGKISIYPNPTSSVVTVSLADAPRNDWNVTIMNSNGQVVLQKKYSRTSSVISMPVTHLPSGNYTLEVADGNATQSNKLMINHQ